jgi:hypothetical protein
MNLLTTSSNRLALGLLCVDLMGCKSQMAPLANGYESVTHPTHSSVFDPELPRVSFQFRESSGKTILIWPSLYGVNNVVKGPLAIFVGDTAYVDVDGKTTRPRLFAVKAPELPIDITDEVLRRWSKSTGKDFAEALSRYSLVTPVERDDRLELHLEFWTAEMLSEDKAWPDSGDVRLDWKQVSDIRRAEKIKGVVKKDLRWHTPYIGEKF